MGDALSQCKLLQQVLDATRRERDAAEAELEAWKKAVEDDASPACFNCGAPCKACAELDAAQQKIAELTAALPAPAEHGPGGMQCGPDWEAQCFTWRKEVFRLRAELAEAEQRGFARGVEAAIARLREMDPDGDLSPRRVVDDCIDAIRQLAKPPEQKEAAVELYDGDTGTISIVEKP